MTSVEQSVERELTGEIEVLEENLPHCQFVHHKSHMTCRTRAAEVESRRLTAWAIFSFGATAHIWALAYLHETFLFHFSLLDLGHSVGLLGRVISSSQGIYLFTTQKNAHTQTLNIHALSEIRTHDPGFRASEDSTRFRPHGYRDRQPPELWHGLIILQFPCS
jgi:hypothetical protein